MSKKKASPRNFSKKLGAAVQADREAKLAAAFAAVAAAALADTCWWGRYPERELGDWENITTSTTSTTPITAAAIAAAIAAAVAAYNAEDG
jgi:hypothetical protein